MKGKKPPAESAQNPPAQKKKAASRRKPENPGPAPVAGSRDNSAATKRFLEDLAIRGEAVDVPEGGKLPAQATHVITKRNPDGTIEVKRKRFKLV